MKKLRSEFFTETEANDAMEKIIPYCGAVRVIYNGEDYNNRGYDYNLGDGDFYGFPGMGAMNFGDFGIFGGWTFVPNFLDVSYSRALSRSNFGHDYQSSGRATLEADVADDNLEYVREKLYSLGAVSVS